MTKWTVPILKSIQDDIKAKISIFKEDTKKWEKVTKTAGIQME